MPKGNLTMNFSAYGLLFALGIAISAIVAILICKKRNIERYEIVYSGVFTMAGAVIGAKLFFLLVSIKLIIETKPGIPDLIRGGFVFYGGLVGGMIASLLVYFIFTEKGLIFGSGAIWLEAILFALSGIACAVLTAFGDLVESVIKRKLGIKDMGKLLPGHGGMSDRIDGLTFTAPVVAFVFTILIPIINGGILGV